jgi:hypothetical protein
VLQRLALDLSAFARTTEGATNAPQKPSADGRVLEAAMEA